MNFEQLDVAQQEAVQRAIVSEWRRLQGYRYIVAPGTWHVCKRGACRMVQLACNIRLYHDGSVKIVAPSDQASNTVAVRTIFVCWRTGKVHVCGNACRRDATGACQLTGHRHRQLWTGTVQSAANEHSNGGGSGSTVAARRAGVNVHRRGATVGMDVVRHATRDILEYLCFSDTRRRYAARLLDAARGKTRRWCTRVAREQCGMNFCHIVEYYGSAVFTARACARPLRMPAAKRERLLEIMAECVHRLHTVLGHDVITALSGSVRVFSLAALYLMRTGLRSSATGQMVVPRVNALAVMLPNAHLLSSTVFPEMYETQNRSRQLTNSIRFLSGAILKIGTTQNLDVSGHLLDVHGFDEFVL